MTRSALVLACLLFPTLAATQQGRDFTGERLYNAVLGCGTCHGPDGGGGLGPPLHRTTLPLRAVLHQVRTPRGGMPAFSPRDASDARLAAVYAWLRGSEAVQPPLLLGISIPGKLEAWHEARVQGTVNVTPTDATVPAPPARFRIFLAGRDGLPVAGHRLELRRGWWRRWRGTTTDADGGAPLPISDDETRLAFRIATLPQGKYTLVVEARSREDGELLGIGSAPAYVW